MKHKYKAVIFDFNGTLFFDNDKHVLAWGAISKQIRGHDICDEELHLHINGVPNKQVIQYLMNTLATNKDLEKYSDLKEKYYRTFCKEDNATFHLVAGTIEYFKYLKEESIPFTIASASIKKNIDFFVESFTLDKWINKEDIIYDNGTYTNKVQMFLDAAKKLHTNICDVLIVEDSMAGVENAYQAGCHNIIVVNSANKKEKFENMPGVIKVINDLTEVMIP